MESGKLDCFSLSDIQKYSASQMTKVLASSHEYQMLKNQESFMNRISKVRQATRNWIQDTSVQ